ncbi:hypothetical protein H476_0011 [[Clostridium] sordellii VPI 9048]|nr:hypothetical protein H476_0011 [[Clostridium] sordellii VPI 9048] [Paeniclostridium sordellii VPI 9048]
MIIYKNKIKKIVVIIVGAVDKVDKYLNQNKYKDINMCIKC